MLEAQRWWQHGVYFHLTVSANAVIIALAADEGCEHNR
jgi:hypothetical protein